MPQGMHDLLIHHYALVETRSTHISFLRFFFLTRICISPGNLHVLMRGIRCPRLWIRCGLVESRNPRLGDPSHGKTVSTSLHNV